MAAELEHRLAQLEVAYDGPDVLIGKGAQTLMLRNLPRSFTPDHVIKELEAIVPKKSFDYVYLPWDMRRGSNISFAFVNFVNDSAARLCFLMLSGKRWTAVETTKCCRLTAADVQGLAENLAHYVVNTNSDDLNLCGPVIFYNGKQIHSLQIAVSKFCTAELLNQVRLDSVSSPERSIKKGKSVGVFGKAPPGKTTQELRGDNTMTGTDAIAQFTDALAKAYSGFPRQPALRYGKSEDIIRNWPVMNLDAAACARTLQNLQTQRLQNKVLRAGNEGVIEQHLGRADALHGDIGCFNGKRCIGMPKNPVLQALPVGEITSNRSGLNSHGACQTVCRPPSPEDIPSPKIGLMQVSSAHKNGAWPGQMVRLEL